jgi:dihydroxyacetone kinase
MKQVLSAIASVPSSAGTILLITNYTGDKLHFGLAAERALAAGLAKKCVVLPATDDVSIPRSRCEKVGRRGLAGNVISEFDPLLCIFVVRKENGRLRLREPG